VIVKVVPILVAVAGCSFDASGAGTRGSAIDPSAIDAMMVDPVTGDASVADAPAEVAASCEDVCQLPGICLNGTCQFNCGGSCQHVTCPPGVPCRVNCIAADACTGAIDCTAASE